MIMVNEDKLRTLFLKAYYSATRLDTDVDFLIDDLVDECRKTSATSVVIDVTLSDDEYKLLSGEWDTPTSVNNAYRETAEACKGKGLFYGFRLGGGLDLTPLGRFAVKTHQAELSRKKSEAH